MPCQFVFGMVNVDNIEAMFVSGATAESETVSGTNAATTEAATGGQTVCRVSTDTACYVSFGAAPNAGTDAVRFMMPAGSVDYFRIKAGDKAAVIAIA